jgi:hypothetical protein
MTPRRTAAVLIATVATVGLTACGGGDDDNGVADKPAEEILDDATSAAAEAESARINGEFVDDDGLSTTFDLEFDETGAAGTLTVENAEFEITSVDGTFYMKGAADAWDQFAGEGAGQIVADKYVLIPADQAGGFETFTDISSFTDELLTPDGEVSIADETEIDGQKVVGLTSDAGGFLYIATTGDPLPVQLKAPEGEDGAANFEWNIDVDIEAPPEDEIVDFSTLG